MAVRIGQASIDENGNISGGAAGDQTGKEVYTRNWYLHSQGWIVIRAKSAEAREKIAQDMEWACENPNIGYDQGQNTTLYQVARKVGFNCSKVTTPCETDCARLVRICVLYAGIDCDDFYTGSEVAALKKTGQFDILTSAKYTESSDYLLRGDILVTKTKGHTLVILSDGSKVTTPESPQKEDADQTVKPATNFRESLAGQYRVSTALNLRSGAGTSFPVIAIMPGGTIVRNYGYFTPVNGTPWLLVVYKGKVGYCSSKYLKKE